MPGSEEEIYRLLAELSVNGGIVAIEKIPKWCGAARFAKQTIRASSLAELYGNYMFTYGVAMSYFSCDNVHLVTPQKWQKTTGCANDEKLEKKEWKNKLKAHAQRLFPNVKVTLATSDALCILDASLKLFR